MSYEFNLGNGEKAARKKLKTYVDVPTTGSSGTYNWCLVGRGVEDSSIELNPNEDKKTDILGITDTDITKLEKTQSFDPNTIRGGAGFKELNEYLHSLLIENQLEKFSQFNVMTVYEYIDGSDMGSFAAIVEKNCTITPQSLGGSSYVDMPIQISYSNDIIKGTVTYSAENGKPTFTAGTLGSVS